MSASMAEPRMEWWRSAVLYQIYVRSFSDSDGDGLGDLAGIRARLPYVRDLGVDGIWLTPFYPTPDADHGYDVSDYEDVDPRLGTLAGFDALVADAHALGLRVVVDLVPNHTSSEHPWFRNALADPEHPDRARYIFRPGRDGGPPNNWESAFGGSAWTLDERSGEYYLHLFASEQPDLDWHNDVVRADFEQILRFWLDRDVDGFRIDVAQSLYKARDLADIEHPEPRPRFADWHTGIQQPELHDLYREWRHIVDAYPGDRVLVGEIVLGNQATLAEFVRRDELHQVFNFRFLHEEWDAERCGRRSTRRSTHSMRSAPRRPGCSRTTTSSASPRATEAATGRAPCPRRGAAHARAPRRGVPLCGPGARPGGGRPAERAPPGSRVSSYRRRAARTRRMPVPIPWQPGPGFGFTTGTPWLPMPAEWASLSVQAQEGAAPRHSSSSARRCGSDGRYRPSRRARSRWRESPPGTLVFERSSRTSTVVCMVNIDADALPSRVTARCSWRAFAGGGPPSGGERGVDRRLTVPDGRFAGLCRTCIVLVNTLAPLAARRVHSPE